MAQILVIDDDELQRKTLKKILEREGFNVDVACDGMDAPDYLKENSIQLILTDIYMPEMDGFELIEKIQKEYFDIKIIAMSGGELLHAKEITQRLAVDLGIARFSHKLCGEKA